MEKKITEASRITGLIFLDLRLPGTREEQLILSSRWCSRCRCRAEHGVSSGTVSRPGQSPPPGGPPHPQAPRAFATCSLAHKCGVQGLLGISTPHFKKALSSLLPRERVRKGKTT